MPVLKHGDHEITQSLAILEYIEDIWPSPKLIPQSPFEKAEVKAELKAEEKKPNKNFIGTSGLSAQTNNQTHLHGKNAKLILINAYIVKDNS